MNLDFGLNNLYAVSTGGRLNDNSQAYLHTHPFHEILVIKNGVSILIDEKSRQPVYGNLAAFIPAHSKHKSIIIGDSIIYQVIFFNRKLFESNESNIKIFDISELGLAFLNRFKSDDFFDLSSGFLCECFQLFLKLLAEDLNKKVDIVSLPEPKDANNLKIVEYIHNNYAKKIKSDDFESVLSYSTRHISRMFQQELSITVFEYLRLYRILMASIGLFEQNKKIADIAFSVGYESLSVFYKDFNKYFGVSPKEFRSMVRC